MLEPSRNQTQLAELDLADAQGHVWDFVVIGTGAGGAATGFNLARLGRSVLFIERGGWLHSAPNRQREHNDFCMTSAGRAEFCVSYLDQFQSVRPNCRFKIPVGCGVGGSTALFGMVMERFRPEDFEPHRFYDMPHGASLTSSWPVQYEELVPYYEQAERLFRVRGTGDPLGRSRASLLAPPAPSDTETNVREALEKCGLHPYRIHSACERIDGCDGCFRKPCPNNCRNDAARVCIDTALEHHNARILTNCRVSRLEAEAREVRSAVCIKDGVRAPIRAHVFVLALHAVFTPSLLLRSVNQTFPDGLGNSSGLVGRNLMLHVSDSVLVGFRLGSDLLNGSLNHGIGMNDFYVQDRVKLGNIHAHTLDFSSALQSSKLDASGSALFHTIVEDFPYFENRIVPAAAEEQEPSWIYQYRDELWKRSQLLVQKLTQALCAKYEAIALRPHGNLNLGHACGTCRSGDDERSSVLDRHNRMHDLDNVFVVDGSFFPTSGGINPSLTIIANGLRVADRLAQWT